MSNQLPIKIKVSYNYYYVDINLYYYKVNGVGDLNI